VTIPTRLVSDNDDHRRPQRFAHHLRLGDVRLGQLGLHHRRKPGLRHPVQRGHISVRRADHRRHQNRRRGLLRHRRWRRCPPDVPGDAGAWRSCGLHRRQEAAAASLCLRRGLLCRAHRPARRRGPAARRGAGAVRPDRVCRSKRHVRRVPPGDHVTRHRRSGLGEGFCLWLRGWRPPPRALRGAAVLCRRARAHRGDRRADRDRFCGHLVGRVRHLRLHQAARSAQRSAAAGWSRWAPVRLRQARLPTHLADRAQPHGLQAARPVPARLPLLQRRRGHGDSDHAGVRHRDPRAQRRVDRRRLRRHPARGLRRGAAVWLAGRSDRHQAGHHGVDRRMGRGGGERLPPPRWRAGRLPRRRCTRRARAWRSPGIVTVVVRLDDPRRLIRRVLRLLLGVLEVLGDLWATALRRGWHRDRFVPDRHPLPRHVLRPRGHPPVQGRRRGRQGGKGPATTGRRRIRG